MNKEVSNVAGSYTVKGFLYEEKDLKFNTKCYRKPLQLGVILWQITGKERGGVEYKILMTKIPGAGKE